jgi:hypothetical protein
MRTAIAAFAIVAIATSTAIASAEPVTTHSSTSVAVPKAANGYPWHNRISRARAYARERAGRIGFAVIDEEGNLLGGMRVHEGFRSASTVKVVMMTCYLNYKTVRNRALTMRDRDLLAPMIRRSENGPASSIYGFPGPECIKHAAKKLGLEGFTTESIWGRSRVTPAGIARMFKRVDKVIVERHRKYALQLLGSVIKAQRWGLPPVKPPGWGIRFKGGWAAAAGGGRIVNQGAMFVNGKRRFTIAVLTDGSPTHEYGTRTISGIGKRLLRNYESYPAPS